MSYQVRNVVLVYNLTQTIIINLGLQPEKQAADLQQIKASVTGTITTTYKTFRRHTPSSAVLGWMHKSRRPTVNRESLATRFCEIRAIPGPGGPSSYAELTKIHYLATT